MFLSTVATHGSKATCPASSIPIGKSASVCFVIRMAVLAEVFLYWSMIPLARNVLAPWYGLQVLWPNAVAHMAQVVDLVSLRDRANEKFVSEAVGEPVLGEHAIPVLHNRPCPEPARFAFLNLVPEALFFCGPLRKATGKWEGNLALTGSLEVSIAKATCVARSLTFIDQAGRLMLHRELHPSGVMGRAVSAVPPLSVYPMES